MRIVTKSIEAYSVMEDCLRIARGVTVKRNVYVWSRRRQHMEDAWRHLEFFRKCLDNVYHFILFDNIFILPILFEMFFILLSNCFLYYYLTAFINTHELNHKPYFPHVKFFLITFELTLKRNIKPYSAKLLLLMFY